MTNRTSKPDTAARQAAAWQTFKDRDAWIRAFMAVSNVTCTAKIVGTRIAFHHNIETGRCDPDLATLAAGTGMNDRNVRRMLRELEQSGWLLVESRGFHHSNSFSLLIPAREDDRTTVSALRPDNSCPPFRCKTGQSGSDDRTIRV